MDLQIGSTLGDYQIIGILGAGGMGKVYKVRNVISDRVEAMKVLLPDLANAPELADRFLREIKVQASLEHPNIAALHTAVRQDNQLLMLMEFVDGQTLEQRLKQGPIPVPLAVDYIGQVLSALEFAHAHGVIHRDIKPANMMLTPNGVVKLMDFGIAKASSDHKLTMTGTTMGSLYYMSPEQIQGAANLDARADLYSVGVSLYEMVTGKRPFDGDSQFAIMSAHLEKTPVPPVTLDPRLPQALNDIILMSVAKAPDARFQTAKAFRNALSSTVAAPTLDAQVAVAAAAPQGLAGKPPIGRRGMWMAIGAVVAVAALVGIIEFPARKTIQAAHPVSAPAPATVITPAPAPAENAVCPHFHAGKGDRRIFSAAQATACARSESAGLATATAAATTAPTTTAAAANAAASNTAGDATARGATTRCSCRPRTQPRRTAKGARRSEPAEQSGRDRAQQHAKPATLASLPGPRTRGTVHRTGRLDGYLSARRGGCARREGPRRRQRFRRQSGAANRNSGKTVPPVNWKVGKPGTSSPVAGRSHIPRRTDRRRHFRRKRQSPPSAAQMASGRISSQKTWPLPKPSRATRAWFGNGTTGGANSSRKRSPTPRIARW